MEETNLVHIWYISGSRAQRNMKYMGNAQNKRKSYTKIPPTKHDVPVTKYDDPFLFTRMNSIGQHMISCKALFSSKDHPLNTRITLYNSILPLPISMRYMKCCSSPVKNVHFKGIWYSVRGMPNLVFVNDIWYVLNTFCMWSLWALSWTYLGRIWDISGTYLGHIWDISGTYQVHICGIPGAYIKVHFAM